MLPMPAAGGSRRQSEAVGSTQKVLRRPSSAFTKDVALAGSIELLALGLC